MNQRFNILNKLLNGIKLPHSEVVRDLDRDYKAIYKMLFRRNKTQEIGITKQREDSTLWFFRRKN